MERICKNCKHCTENNECSRFEGKLFGTNEKVFKSVDINSECMYLPLKCFEPKQEYNLQLDKFKQDWNDPKKYKAWQVLNG